MTESSLVSPQLRELLGYKLLDERFPNLLNVPRETVVATLNPHSWVSAQHDSPFREALLRADVLVADGVGMVLASLLLNGRKIKRVTGSNVFAALMAELQQCGGRCFFLGSTPKVLGLINQRMRADYPTVSVGGFSPPFASEFDEAQITEMVLKVNAFAPDVLFLGLTAPRQEKLAERLRGRVKIRVIASIGAVFDFVAGTQPRAPTVMCRLGLEWAYRLLREPRRLWQRNFISTPLFIGAALAARMGLGKRQPPHNFSSRHTDGNSP